MVKTACPVAVLVAEVRSLPGIHLSCFPVFDPSRSRIGSVIADLVLAAGLFAAGSGSIAAAVVVAVLDFAAAGFARLNQIAVSVGLCSFSSAGTGKGKGRVAAPVVSCFLILRGRGGLLLRLFLVF